jgi:hypothetical protein
MVAKKCAVARIRELNDRMRTAGFSASGDGARWVLTKGVAALGSATVLEAVRRVADFEAFDDGNDPHGEHDFGALELAGERLFWKIDYYDHSVAAGSEDPSDEAVTCRVLTIMLASES